jgi:Flp pilus assembly pilin Flp
MVGLMRIVLVEDDSGQGLAEYALILFLVSIVSFLALTNMGTTISGLFTTVVSDI